MSRTLRKIKTPKDRHSDVFCKKAVLAVLEHSLYIDYGWHLFLIKLQAFWPATLLKKDPAEVVFREFCENFKNTYFVEHMRMTASGVSPKKHYSYIKISKFIIVPTSYKKELPHKTFRSCFSQHI